MHYSDLTKAINYELKNDSDEIRVLLPFTGGRDSLLILLQLIHNTPLNGKVTLTIDLLYVLVGQGPGKASMEIEAINQQMNLIREQKLLENKNIVINLKLPEKLHFENERQEIKAGLMAGMGKMSNCAFSQLPKIIQGVMTECFDRHYDYLMFGWHLGDHVMLIYREVIQNLMGLLSTMLLGRVPEIRVPLLTQEKAEIIRLLRWFTGFSETVWACEIPTPVKTETTIERQGFTLKECGCCPACVTYAAAKTLDVSYPLHHRSEEAAVIAEHTLVDIPRRLKGNVVWEIPEIGDCVETLDPAESTES